MPLSPSWFFTHVAPLLSPPAQWVPSSYVQRYYAGMQNYCSARAALSRVLQLQPVTNPSANATFLPPDRGRGNLRRWGSSELAVRLPTMIQAKPCPPVPCLALPCPGRVMLCPALPCPILPCPFMHCTALHCRAFVVLLPPISTLHWRWFLTGN